MGRVGKKKGIDTSNSDRLAAAINDHEGLIKGSKVWYKSDDNTWVPGELRSQPTELPHLGAAVAHHQHSKSAGSGAKDEEVTIHIDSEASSLEGPVAKLAGRTLQVGLSRLVPSNPKLQEGIPDLTHLSYLNEPGILYNLKHRYQEDQIYTFAGPVLIALNPCKNLPLYTSEVANEYKAGAKDTVNTLAPHIYLVAANAFRKMLRERQNQSLIVNGESGAGKTETTKKAMQYFATLAGGTGIEDQVLETNPILEAFGNAKTLRNHNSSRFGKLIQIHFNKSNHICGACIKTYLLEKSRVVHQLQGERSYHIFYQLVRGATAVEREAWRLPAKPQGFRYLSQSGCTEITGVDDAHEFKLVRSAMQDVGIPQESQAKLFALLSGLLWLGNIEFVANLEDVSNDSTLITRDAAFEAACTLLGLAPDALCMALTQKRIVTPSEVVTKFLNVEESKDCRDALAKALYAAVFNWIVEQINAKLDTGRSRSSGLSIAILDIYGFEQFQKNSFEQLCINYANERLQQQFTRHLFTLEQQEYEAEGIDWTKVEFVDNQECVDVIELAPPKGLGVLAVLDAQCKFPRASDETFVHKLRESLQGHSHFALVPRDQHDFVILHYAGQVQYSSSGFLDKNKDMLNNDLIELMLGSNHELLQMLGQGVRDENESKSRSGGQTVGGRFSTQLKELIAELDTTGLHFVRCIKPNSQLLPNKFEGAMTLHQLRCCGVLEVARIARAGFPTRYEHAQFAERYSILLPKEDQEELARGGSALGACQLLLQYFALDKEQYQVGRTKVFFRPGVLGYVEDRWARMQSAVVKVQAFWRMHRFRSRFLRLRNAATCMQSVYRGKVERLAYKELVRQTRAAVVIQRHYKAHYTRKQFVRKRRSALVIQCAWRLHRFNKRVRRREHLEEKRRIEEKLRKQEEARQLNNVLASSGMASVEDLVIAVQSQKKMAEELEAARKAREDMAERIIREQEEMKGKMEVEMKARMEEEMRAAMDKEREEMRAKLEQEMASKAPAPGSVAARVAAFSGVGAVGAAMETRSAGGRPGGGPDSGGDRSGPSSGPGAYQGPPSTGVSRFEEHNYLKEQLEKVQLENIKLNKALNLERQLKERYQHKYEEHQVNWLEQIRTLQEYIQTVKLQVGEGRLPPMPAAATWNPAAHTVPPSPAPGAARSIGGMQTPFSTAAVPSSSGGAALVAAERHGAANGHAAQAQPSTPRENGDAMGVPASSGDNDSHRWSGTIGPSASVAAANSPSFTQPAERSLHGHPSENGAPGSSVGGAPSDTTPTQARMDQQAARGMVGAPQFPPIAQQSGPQKYVGQLKGELDRVSQVLRDDVEFVVEVRQGMTEAPDMDPAKELAKLRKKFDIWRKEFKDKLRTAEEVMKKIDKLGSTQGPPVSQSLAHPPHQTVSAGGAGGGGMAAFAQQQRVNAGGSPYKGGDPNGGMYPAQPQQKKGWGIFK